MLRFRQARTSDLALLIDMLANDELGKQREDVRIPINPNYVAAIEAITRDPNNTLIVAESGARLLGMMQLTFIPYLTHVGSWRCLIEAVRVHESYRGKGVGESMFDYAIDLARKKGCTLVQLTSDKQRPDALRFYQKIGFNATHEGFKMTL